MGPFWVSFSSSWGPAGRPWRLPRCSWGLLASSPGALWRDLDLPSRHSELLRRPFTCARGSWRHFETSPGGPRCDFDVWNGATELQTHDHQILVISYFIKFHWSFGGRHSNHKNSSSNGNKIKYRAEEDEEEDEDEDGDEDEEQ